MCYKMYPIRKPTHNKINHCITYTYKTQIKCPCIQMCDKGNFRPHNKLIQIKSMDWVVGVTAVLTARNHLRTNLSDKLQKTPNTLEASSFVD